MCDECQGPASHQCSLCKVAKYCSEECFNKRHSTQCIAGRGAGDEDTETAGEKLVDVIRDALKESQQAPPPLSDEKRARVYKRALAKCNDDMNEAAVISEIVFEALQSQYEIDRSNRLLQHVLQSAGISKNVIDIIKNTKEKCIALQEKIAMAFMRDFHDIVNVDRYMDEYTAQMQTVEFLIKSAFNKAYRPATVEEQEKHAANFIINVCKLQTRASMIGGSSNEEEEEKKKKTKKTSRANSKSKKKPLETKRTKQSPGTTTPDSPTDVPGFESPRASDPLPDNEKTALVLQAVLDRLPKQQAPPQGQPTEKSLLEREIDWAVRKGEIAGVVLTQVLFGSLIYGFVNFVDNVTSTYFKDIWRKEYLRLMANETETTNAIETLNKTRNATLTMQDMISRLNLTRFDKEYLLQNYTMSLSQAENMTLSLITVLEKRPQFASAAPTFRIIVEKIQNGTVTQDDIDGLNELAKAVAPHTIEGVFFAENVNVLSEFKKYQDEIAKNNAEEAKAFDTIYDTLIKKREMDREYTEFVKRLEIQTTPEAFLTQLINKLQSVLPPGQASMVAHYLTSTYGIQLMSTVSKIFRAPMSAIINDVADEAMFNTTTNLTDTQLNTLRMQMGVELIAETGTAVTFDRFFLLAGVALTANLFDIAAYTCVADAALFFVEKQYLEPQFHQAISDLHSQIASTTFASGGGKRVAVVGKDTQPLEDVSFRGIYVRAGALSLIQNTRSYLAIASVNQCFLGASMCAISYGLRLLRLSALQQMSWKAFTTSVTTLWNMDNRVKSIVGIVGGVALLYGNIYDVYSSARQKQFKQAATTVWGRIGKVASFVNRNSSAINWVLGGVSLLYTAVSIGLSASGLLGEKNQLDVFYWKMQRDKKKWEDRRVGSSTSSLRLLPK